MNSAVISLNTSANNNNTNNNSVAANNNNITVSRFSMQPVFKVNLSKILPSIAAQVRLFTLAIEID
jgi:hypothetical protein